MHDRTEWTRASSGPQTIKGKTYRSLVEFKRPCATCNEPFSIFVTEKIASAHADSNSFALKNCEAHRRNKSNGDMGALAMANGVMKDELDGLYSRISELFAENQVLKARLAGYELQPAMAAVAENKMPWE